jgi:hypothetical protein
MAITARAQHLIVTNNNDTIEAQILEKNDSVFHIKRLQKPKREDYISASLIKKIIANGNDTLYNTYTSFSEDNSSEPMNNKVLKTNFEINEIVLLDSTQTSQVLFNKAQKFIALNFKNSQHVVQLSDRVSGTIICKGTMKSNVNNFIGVYTKGYMHYTITIMVKNGKFKYEVNQISYVPLSSSCYSQSYPINYSKVPCGMFRSEWEEIKENYDFEINDFMKQFKLEMAKPVSDDW